jgi:hypothetical protein
MKWMKKYSGLLAPCQHLGDFSFPVAGFAWTANSLDSQLPCSVDLDFLYYSTGDYCLSIDLRIFGDAK